MKENKLLDALQREGNLTRTENNAVTYKSTLNANLDFFAMGGALRNRELFDVLNIFMNAFNEDNLTALKILFYLRDIRGGQGERKTFRDCATNLPTDILLKNLDNFPKFGRWDDLLEICYQCSGINPTAVKHIVKYIKNKLTEDIIDLKNGKNVSLLGKWMPSENAGKQAKMRARFWIKQLEIPPREYRLMLSRLRKNIDIVEHKICKKQWEDIDYSKIPSKASLKYSSVFQNHDGQRYAQYLSDVEAGKKSINTDTIYPYEILAKAKDIMSMDKQKALSLLWDKLPDYCKGEGENSIVVCDTSGSMTGHPMDVSTSLAIYFAERNRSIWRNKFITFSRNPQFQSIKGKTLYQKYHNLNKADWDMNTDLQAVFELILITAVFEKVPKEDMLDKIYIVSDMEFDHCAELTNYAGIKRRYHETGYEMPKMIFWNVNSRQNQVPVTVNEKGVYLVSGSSPSIFKALMKVGDKTAVEFMMDVINNERYDSVVI